MGRLKKYDKPAQITVSITIEESIWKGKRYTMMSHSGR
jgi:hypothetical protein